MHARLGMQEKDLFFAVVHGDAIAVARLLKYAAPNVKDERGYAPLHWAAERQRGSIIKLLVDAGADVNLHAAPLAPTGRGASRSTTSTTTRTSSSSLIISKHSRISSLWLVSHPCICCSRPAARLCSLVSERLGAIVGNQ